MTTNSIKSSSNQVSASQSAHKKQKASEHHLVEKSSKDLEALKSQIDNFDFKIFSNQSFNNEASVASD